MNPRQRRGVLLMIVAGVGALAVFFTVFTYSTSLQNQYGETRPVLKLTEDIGPYQPITPGMVTTVQVPKRYFEETFLSQLSEVGAQEATEEIVAAAFLHKDALLQKGMLMPAPELDEGEREIAIMVNAETGVAGKVRQGSVVDIYGTYPATEDQSACAIRILTEVEVLGIGEIRDEVDPSTGSQAGVVPVTFRLSAQETLRLTYSEAFAGKLRLGLVSPRGESDAGPKRFCSDTDLTEFQGSGATPDAAPSESPNAGDPSADPQGGDGE